MTSLYSPYSQSGQIQEGFDILNIHQTPEPAPSKGSASLQVENELNDAEAKPGRSEKNRPRVALLIESSRGYGRGLLEGIARYMRTQRTWSVFFQERRRGDPPPAWLKGWKGDGIIARVEDQRLMNAITALRVPAIDLRGLLKLQIPLIETDDKMAVKLAAEHLLERGFKHFAFCGFQGANYSDKRCGYFVNQIKAAGYDCDVFEQRQPKRALRITRPTRFIRESGFEDHGPLRAQAIARWLKKLPRPIAIMACNDVCGQQVLDACRAIRVAVPDEAAVIGVDNDELLCELSDPPLTSVIPDTRRIGFMAAELLDEMMRGEQPKEQITYVAPAGIATRGSTDVLAMEDRDMAAALRYIREHVCEGINVADVVAEVAMSRSLFERRFIRATGRTPKAEIIRARIERVKDMLSSSDLAPRVIAVKSGFQHYEYMCALFKRVTGVTPGEYRSRSRL